MACRAWQKGWFIFTLSGKCREEWGRTVQSEYINCTVLTLLCQGWTWPHQWQKGSCLITGKDNQGMFFSPKNCFLPQMLLLGNISRVDINTACHLPVTCLQCMHFLLNWFCLLFMAEKYALLGHNSFYLLLLEEKHCFLVNKSLI